MNLMRNLKSWKSVENGILRCTELICETLCWNLDLSRNQYDDSMSAVSVKMLEWKVLVLPVLTGRVREILVGFKTDDLVSDILAASFLLALRRLFFAHALLWR